LWDGSPRSDDVEFCSEICQERYAEWVDEQQRYDEEHPEIVTEPQVMRIAKRMVGSPPPDAPGDTIRSGPGYDDATEAV